MITQQQVRRLFVVRGKHLWWRNAKGTRNMTKPVGCKGGRYIRVSIEGKLYSEHRIMFLIMHGYMPALVDHCNRIKHDNTPSNLRAATASENSLNVVASKRSTSGVKNVYRNTAAGKWHVQLCIRGKRMNFGLHKDLELAQLIAEEAYDVYK